MVGVHHGGLTLPARVKEGRHDQDGQGRDAVPLLAGEGWMIIKKLLAGAHKVQKITKFQRLQGKGHAAVQVEWDTSRPTGQARAPADTRGRR